MQHIYVQPQDALRLFRSGTKIFKGILELDTEASVLDASSKGYAYIKYEISEETISELIRIERLIKELTVSKGKILSKFQEIFDLSLKDTKFTQMSFKYKNSTLKLYRKSKVVLDNDKLEELYSSDPNLSCPISEEVKYSAHKDLKAVVGILSSEAFTTADPKVYYEETLAPKYEIGKSWDLFYSNIGKKFDTRVANMIAYGISKYDAEYFAYMLIESENYNHVLQFLIQRKEWMDAFGLTKDNMKTIGHVEDCVATSISLNEDEV